MAELGKSRERPSPARRRYLFGLRPGWTWKDLTDRFRWLRPGALALALAFFALPFLTVSCDTPRWGPTNPGQITTYSGFDLVVNGVPHRGEGDTGLAGTDALRAFPITIIALVLIAAALVVSSLALLLRVRARAGRIPTTRYRALRHAATALTSLALVTHLLGGAVASESLSREVNAGLGRPLGDPAGPGYVHTGQGFVLVTALLVLPLLVSLVSAWSRWRTAREQQRARRRSRGRDGSGAEIKDRHPPDDGRPIGATWSDLTPLSPRTPREPHGPRLSP